MKIGELNEHCGDCPLIEYCTEPYETPQLCTNKALANIDTEIYEKIAENITYEEFQNKIKQQKEDRYCSWDDKSKGAIVDLVLEKIIY